MVCGGLTSCAGKRRPHFRKVRLLVNKIAVQGLAPQHARWTVASRAEEYRGHANECDQRAATARNSEVRSQFEELARQWREMANQIDRMFSGITRPLQS